MIFIYIWIIFKILDGDKGFESFQLLETVDVHNRGLNSDRKRFDYSIHIIISIPLLNITSAAPLSVVLSLLSQKKEGKRGRSVSHV